MIRNFIKNAAKFLLIYNLICGLLFPSYVLALPQDGQVVGGNASINQIDTGNMHITQGSDKAIIDWGSFSIGSGETVRFFQPGSSSVVLNRVIGIDPSMLNGLLSANGKVFLINPNGITVGPTGVINVGSFMATTMNMSNEDFMSGNFQFNLDMNKPLSSIINQGAITAEDGGFVVLAAPYVLNEGTITARLGKVYMASGEEFVLNFTQDGLIGFAVNGAIKDEIIGSDGEALDSNVKNTGEITADGGEVILSARTAYDVVKSVVNNEGIIEAKSIINKNGVIILDGGDSGIVSNSGILDASGKNEGETGGTVEVLGEYVGLFDGSRIDVSGYNSGGTVLIGGDFQGKNPDIQNAFRTFVGEDTYINADAITSGDGGRVIVWADDITRYYGNISARGGSISGDGGFVEVSGKKNLGFHGYVSTLAPNGIIGNLLLDPHDVTINDGGSATALTDADAFTDPTGDGSGDVTIDKDTINAAASNVTMRANNDITLAASSDINIATSGVTLSLEAGRSILLNSNITTNDGAVTLIANETVANGVVDAYRDAGAAVITMADGMTINAGDQNIQILIRNSTDKTANTSGDITLENLTTTGDIWVQNSGPTAGSDILRTSADALIDAPTMAFDVNGTGGSGSIGVSGTPIRITNTSGIYPSPYGPGPVLEARAQSGGMFFEVPSTKLYIQDAALGGLEGLSTTADNAGGSMVSGDIYVELLTSGTGIYFLKNVTTADASQADTGGDDAVSSGSISLLTTGTSGGTRLQDNSGGSVQIISGDATLTGAAAGGTDTITSGSISLRAQGCYLLFDHPTNAVIVGTASRTGATAGTTNAGSITMIENHGSWGGGPNSTIAITVNAATGGTTNNQGIVNYSIGSGPGTGGGGFSSASDLRIGTIDLSGTDASNETLIIQTTNGANITLLNNVILQDSSDKLNLISTGTITQTGGTIAGGTLIVSNTGGTTTLGQANTINYLGTITSTGGDFSLTNAVALRLDGTINAGSNAFSINNGANRVNFNLGGNKNITAGTFTVTAQDVDNLNTIQNLGTTNVVLRPDATTDTIGLSVADSSAFTLTTSDIAELKAGTGTVTIGNSNQTGALTLGAAVDLAGRTVTINSGQINDAVNAISAANLTLDINSGTTANTIRTTVTDTLAIDTTDGTDATGESITVVDTGALNLGTVNLNAGTLDVTTSGAITDSGTLTITGTTTLAAGSGNDITLNTAANNFTGAVSITSGNNVTLVDTNAIVLGASTISGNLSVTASGAITDSGALAVTGTTTLAAGAGNNITLNTAANNFTGAVGITSGNDVTLVDANAIDLAASTVSGNLSVTASGAITDSGTLAVTGTTTLAAGAGNNITLNTAANNFTGAVAITSGNNVTLVDTNAIVLGASTVSGDMSVTAGSDIALNGNLTAVSNTVTLTTTGNIDGAGIITANTATLNAATAGLTTSPEMEVTNLNLTFTGSVGGWSGNLLSNPPPLTQGAVTVNAPGIVQVNSWYWKAEEGVSTGSYTTNYLRLINPFAEILSASEWSWFNPDFFTASRIILEIEEEEELLPLPEAESIEELSLLIEE